MLSLEVVEVVLVLHNLVYSQYQQNLEVLNSFMPNKSYAYLLNVDPSNLEFSKTYNTKLGDIIITFNKNDNDRPLEIHDNVKFTLLININCTLF